MGDRIILAGAVLAALGVIYKTLLAPALRFTRKAQDFFDDWNGRPARAGAAAVPGVMERIGNIEHEVKNNDGSSLKDSAHRIEQALSDHLADSEKKTVAASEEAKAMWRAIEAVAKADPPR